MEKKEIIKSISYIYIIFMTNDRDLRQQIKGPGQSSKYSLLYSIVFDDLERLSKQLDKDGRHLSFVPGVAPGDG